MPLKAFILVIAVPAIEIFLLIKLGGMIGLWPTLGIIFGTAVCGIVLSMTQKSRTVVRVQKAMVEGRPPTDAVMDGLLMTIAGTLLLIPGLITDSLGLLLLLPPVRAGMRQRVSGVVLSQLQAAQSDGGAGAWDDDESVIEAEVIDD